MLFFFFFKQKTAYEMRISDWSSDVCSSDLAALRSCDGRSRWALPLYEPRLHSRRRRRRGADAALSGRPCRRRGQGAARRHDPPPQQRPAGRRCPVDPPRGSERRAGVAARIMLEIGRAHVCTPVTNAQLVCRLVLETKNEYPNMLEKT